MSHAPRTGHARGENRGTQPLARHRVFNNFQVLSEGWYPVCPSRALRRGRCRSFLVDRQRLVLWRGEDGRARALDAFCPHMGADLGNGRVVGNDLRCYFHQWRYDEQGALVDVPALPCGPLPRGVKLAAWPVEEKYGYVWVYSAPVASYPVPEPPGLEGRTCVGTLVASPVLFAHHHVMMVGGIDLQHFATVHGLDVKFDFQVSEHSPQLWDWDVSGGLPPGRTWKLRAMRWLLGERIGYRARFAGGSVAAITYGPEQRWRGTGRKLPPLHVLWGCVPLPDDVSRVYVFIVRPRRTGITGRLADLGLFLLTMALLATLRDDDVKAFPNMRFDPRHLIEPDKSAARLVSLIDRLPVSLWSRES